MKPTLDHFARTEAIHVHGIVRGGQLGWYNSFFRCALEDLFEAACTHAFSSVVPQHGVVLPVNNTKQPPLLSIIGYPRTPTLDFTPQRVLNDIRNLLLKAERPFWQVCVIDPDSRLSVAENGALVSHTPFQECDFPQIATRAKCSVLLTGGDTTREDRWNDFLEALITEELLQLPADWHFMPPLS